MARTTNSQVQSIIEVDEGIIASDSDMAPFIEIANELVTEKCTGDNGPSTAYSDTRLELIERWLAAHFYAIRDPRSTDEKAGPVSVKYENKVDLGLDLTRYGQQAKLLDTNGGLASLDAAVKDGSVRTASISWLGTALD